ncbi:MAG: HupE/UreJ family protein [Kofleriaceae bacterium]
MSRARLALVATALLAWAAPASAHTLGNGYLQLTVRGASASGQLDLAFRDLEDAVGLDVDHDGQVRWREVVERRPELERYVRAGLQLRRGEAPCPLTFGALGAVPRADGAHLVLPLEATCDGPVEALVVDYGLVFEVDAQHRGMVTVSRAGQDGSLRLVERAGPTTFELGAPGGDVAGFVRQGVWHIWIGVDHLCFLIALLLPAVLRRQGARRRPATSFAEVARDVLGVVTAFTLAHSITLALSALGWVRLPVRFVETAIALSVAVAALNNLLRGVDARWAVAFALGLLHGFGFSNVLLDVGLPGQHLVAALLAFNVGVELGQLAVVACFLPLAFLARGSRAYRVTMWLASAAMLVVALRWSLERALS